MVGDVLKLCRSTGQFTGQLGRGRASLTQPLSVLGPDSYEFEGLDSAKLANVAEHVEAGTLKVGRRDPNVPAELYGDDRSDLSDFEDY